MPVTDPARGPVSASAPPQQQSVPVQFIFGLSNISLILLNNYRYFLFFVLRPTMALLI